MYEERRLNRRRFIKSAVILGAGLLGGAALARALGGGPAQVYKAINETNSTEQYFCQTNLNFTLAEKERLNAALLDYKGTTDRLLAQLESQTALFRAKDADAAKYATQLNDLRTELTRLKEKLNSTTEVLGVCQSDLNLSASRLRRVKEAFEHE